MHVAHLVFEQRDQALFRPQLLRHKCAPEGGITSVTLRHVGDGVNDGRGDATSLASGASRSFPAHLSTIREVSTALRVPRVQAGRGGYPASPPASTNGACR
eukprot:2010396-Rhodomonas_salina.1